MACARAGLSIGVDLERHRSRDVSALARFAFSEKEYADLASLAEGRRTERFYTLWVMKEALAKALQLPLLEALQCCTFFEDREGRWRGHAPTAQHWQVRVFEPLAGLSLALAIVGDEPLTVLGTFSWPPARAASWRLVASVAKYS